MTDIASIILDAQLRALERWQLDTPDELKSAADIAQAQIDQAKAETAAAYAVATKQCDEYLFIAEIKEAIEALTPSDAKAALDKMLADAQAEERNRCLNIIDHVKRRGVISYWAETQLYALIGDTND